jgi:hypothetical protein
MHPQAEFPVTLMLLVCALNYPKSSPVVVQETLHPHDVTENAGCPDLA